MAKHCITQFTFVFVCIVLGLPALGQVLGDAHTDFKASFVGSALACSQPEKLTIPKSVIERAKLKARLLNLLRDSIYDDAKGIVNTAREREIADVASKLKQEKAW